MTLEENEVKDFSLKIVPVKAQKILMNSSEESFDFSYCKE